jgi:tripartite-type tricarboxylate transporter receptor subunit TctC
MTALSRSYGQPAGTPRNTGGTIVLNIFFTPAIRRGLIAILLMVMATPARSDTYPSRPIRIVHGFAPGGAADTLSRIVAEELSKRLGQPVIVESKPGAGGNIAASAVAKATPDGYTIGLVTGAHAISGAMYKSLNFQPVDSFDMISTIIYYALVIAVRSDHPAKTLPDLVAMARTAPETVGYGTVGVGSTHHLAGEWLNILQNIKMFHVPYRGDAQSITALLGGDVPMIIGTSVLLGSQIESGAVRALAVTSPQRIAMLPQVPTAEELGVKGFDVRTWAGLLAPKGTPSPIIERLNSELRIVLDEPNIKARLEAAVAGEVRGSTPEEMKTLVQGEIAKWNAVVDKAHIPRI